MASQPSGLLVPAYDYPSPGDWDVLTDIGRTMMLDQLLVVADHDHGHFTEVDNNYKGAIDALRGVCTPVLGYVHDCYNNTRTDETCPRTTDIIDDVDRWFSMYRVDGIFIDQLLPELAQHAGDLVAEIRSRHSDAIVVVNPGRIPPEDESAVGTIPFLVATDPAIVVIQEQAWANYEGENWPPPNSWISSREEDATPSIGARRLAIIAHTLDEPEEVDLLIDKAAQYKIGWIYAQHGTGSIYDPLSIHLRLLEARLGRCSRLGCTTPFSRFLCQLMNFFVCYILRTYRRLRVVARRHT